MSETTNSNIRSTGQSMLTPIVSEVGTRSLGQTFRDARLDKSLDLRDIASQTRVRKQYLLSLEEGNYDALPENVYTRNFIRLFAGAVGLDSTAMLELYDRERATFEGKSISTPALASAQPTSAPRTAPAQQNLAVVRRQPASRNASGSGDAGMDIGNILPTLLLVIVIVGLALWAWDSGYFPNAGVEQVSTAEPAVGVLINPRDSSVDQPDVTVTQPEISAIEPISPTEDVTTTADDATASSSVALLSIATVPDGATVSVDNYVFPSSSPIENAPLSAGANRVLRVELEGYRTYEAPIDLSFNRNLEVYLTPLGEVDEDVTEAATEGPVGELVDIDNPTASGEDLQTDEDNVTADSTDDLDVASSDDVTAEAVPIGPLTVSVEIVDAASWLEVYQGDDRGVGTTLLYRTAQPGETFEYEAPVYLFAGNAGNVLVSVDGGDPEAIGTTGQVTGQAFTEESSVE
ncbi:MAG: RodZ domain-containing protein [Deinococcota bacterium]